MAETVRAHAGDYGEDQRLKPSDRDTMSSDADLTRILSLQRTAFMRDGAPGLAQRKAALAKLKQALLARRKRFEATIDADFGHRPAYETAIMELVPLIAGIDYLSAHLARWMRPRRVPVGLHFRPGRAEIIYQPLGIIGIMAPWNYPLGLCLMPLATALAAGNRAMLKPSEFTPRTSDLMAEMLREIFTEAEVATITGGPDVGAGFSALPFDHLIFTGSTSVGRSVMRAAAGNLVPVTLELGGKSPAIVAPGFSLARAAASIAFGKLANAGQTCIAPDYALVQEAEVEAFATAFKHAVSASYPKGAADDSYAAIINDHHYDRLKGLIEDARTKGAAIIEIGATDSLRPHTLAPTLMLDVTDEMKVMQEEIFGPVLPIVAYKELDDAIAYVNAHPRPLALYVFSDDQARAGEVLARTTSGNATVNDCLLHYAVDALPFGGIGPSGMGAYHGEAGFKALSHAKGVFIQSRWNLAGLMRAPFGRMTDAVLSFFLR
jgi:coniferyl-aldehyde dehydrogenase